jgi:phenylpyruvate tautomerase PptA (4-oxalocrotonate tautomerase family)
MPFARIDLIAGTPDTFRQALGAIVYDAMVETLKAPAGDRFQVITEHTPANFIYDPAFLGIERTPGCIFIQLTLIGSRTLEQKRAFYRRVADDLHAQLGVRREDVVISLVPVTAEDWSFGNGEASLVKS